MAIPFALCYYLPYSLEISLDFTHISITPSSLFNENEAGVVLKFNYTDARSLFEIGKWFEGQLQAPLLEARMENIKTTKRTNICSFLRVVRKQLRERVDVQGFRCMQNCPKQNNTTGTNDSFHRNQGPCKDRPYPYEELFSMSQLTIIAATGATSIEVENN